MALANVSEDFCKALPKINKAEELLVHIEKVGAMVEVVERTLPVLLDKAKDFQPSEMEDFPVNLLSREFADFCGAAELPSPLQTAVASLEMLGERSQNLLRERSVDDQCKLLAALCSFDSFLKDNLQSGQLVAAA